jgi:hypothetical protein
MEARTMKTLVVALTLALAPGLAQAAEGWARLSNRPNQLYAYRLDTVKPAVGGVGEVTVIDFSGDGFDYKGRLVRFTVARRAIDCAAWTYKLSTVTLYDIDGGRIADLAIDLAPQDSRPLLADKDLHRLVCEGRQPTALETADSLAGVMAQLKAARRP